jgi:WD40-like Beta Propeller Repeat
MQRATEPAWKISLADRLRFVMYVVLAQWHPAKIADYRAALILFAVLSPTVGQESVPARFLFSSQGRVGMACVDPPSVRYLDLNEPHQRTWQPGPILPQGRGSVLLSMEQRKDGPGRPFDKFYAETRTHLWLYDFERASLQEIGAEHRLAPFVTPQLLLADGRLLVQVIRDGKGQLYSIELDGTDPRVVTSAEEGLPYGLSLSPDGTRIAFHLAGPEGYQVWTANPDGTDRKRVAGQPGHLYFGTNWSPDGVWIAYVDCHFQDDPGHDWGDVCVGRADGSEHRVLTEGQAMWFGATYGDLQTRGGGSNIPAWTRDGHVLFPQRTLEAKVPWEYQANRPDTDHFNRDFKPDLARGGTTLCLAHLGDGSLMTLFPAEPGRWDFRASESPDGKWIVFCRAEVGKPPAIWVSSRDGKNAQVVTNGIDQLGADHPRWLP